ncbi:MAG TPA: BfmA/BtgA family mobilization protein [Flavobacteriaceae bacterium]|nr:BfmA/BtgA family mobilization protein [Flavobacteriaceae bacterium]HQU22416.1 BfmA/BtgA family mobilization protein [Flavobacteriaceae bacterium]HQU66333.1 BfmA/BtgA family mobilization protein [Flavobacteriaceae bacterium]HRW43685.1 BfmA/BtgA family mobilization protein [Flavobacteriaceae bacterium]
MDNFYTIRFKRATAKRFKSFSKKVSNSYSETMEHIIDFFEWHGFSPTERFERSVGKELARNRKRTEAVIAIIRDIEKSQTKPTTAMLQQLFEEASQEEKEETYDFGTPTLIEENEELTHYRNGYFELKKTFQLTHNEIQHLLNKIQYVKNTFGGGSLKLDMTKEEFEQLKERIDYVYHNHTPEVGR